MSALVTYDTPRPLPSSPAATGRSRALAVTLAVIVGVAALLRFWGLRHGIPFALGVDEPEIMERAVRMMRTGDFNPHFFDYPSLYIYVQTAMAVARFVWGALQGEWSALAQAAPASFYLWGRAVTATMGTATVYAVYRCGRRWDELTGLLGAALFAVMPLHVRESHFVLTDVPTTLFVVLAFLCSLGALERPRLRTFVLAGAMAGLAGALKYNGILVVVLPLVAGWTARGAVRSRLTITLAIAAACGAAFLAGAPYTLLDLPTFLNQFARLASQYRVPSGPPPAITYLKHLRNAFEWPAIVLVVAGFLVAAWRIASGPERPKWLLLVLFPLLYFWFISRQHIVFARYLLPLTPFLALIAAAAIVALVRALAPSWLPRRTALAVGAVVALLAWVPQAAVAYAFDRDAAKTWTSALADAWIRTNLPPGSTVVIESRNLLLGPPYNATNVPQLRARTVDDYRRAGVDYLVASSESFGPYFRHPETEGYADYMRLFRDTQEVARFIASDQHPGSELRVLKVPR